MRSLSALKVVVVGAVAAALLQIARGRIPWWLRVGLVAAAATVAVGACFSMYRHWTQPTTLTIAAGSVDGDAVRLMSAIAARMNTAGGSVRVKVLDKGNALEAAKAFSTGEVNLAVVRGDVGDLAAARTVVIITHGIVLIVVPDTGTIKSIDDLKGKTVGVISADVNRRIVEAISKDYDLGAKTRFQNINANDAQQAFMSKKIQAILVVMPITEKYLIMLRNIFQSRGKPSLKLLPIESARAIAAVDQSYESFDLPKGTLHGSPPNPDEDLTTLRISYYLMANKKSRQ